MALSLFVVVAVVLSPHHRGSLFTSYPVVSANPALDLFDQSYEIIPKLPGLENHG